MVVDPQKLRKFNPAKLKAYTVNQTTSQCLSSYGCAIIVLYFIYTTSYINWYFLHEDVHRHMVRDYVLPWLFLSALCDMQYQFPRRRAWSRSWLCFSFNPSALAAIRFEEKNWKSNWTGLHEKRWWQSANVPVHSLNCMLYHPLVCGCAPTCGSVPVHACLLCLCIVLFHAPLS